MVDKSLLENHGSTIGEDTILAVRLVMDVLHGFGVSLRFPIRKHLLISVKGALRWYRTVVETKKAANENENE